MARRSFLFFVFSMIASMVFSQDKVIEPQVSDTVIKYVAISACNCMGKVDIQTLVTVEQRKAAMNNCFVQAATENDEVIAKDQNAEMQKGREAGKQYGMVLGQKLAPLLMQTCPSFKQLVQ